MAVFRAPKGYHFSEDGTPATTWANFEHVPGSDPVAYEFETDTKSEIAALRQLIDDEVEGYTDIVEVVEKPAKKAPAKKAPAKKAAPKAGDHSEGDGESDPGDSGDGDGGGDPAGD